MLLITHLVVVLPLLPGIAAACHYLNLWCLVLRIVFRSVQAHTLVGHHDSAFRYHEHLTKYWPRNAGLQGRVTRRLRISTFRGWPHNTSLRQHVYDLQTKKIRQMRNLTRRLLHQGVPVQRIGRLLGKNVLATRCPSTIRNFCIASSYAEPVSI